MGAYKLTTVESQHKRSLVTENTPREVSYVHQHSLYFLNAKCTQSTLMQKHSRRSLSIPNVTELPMCRHLYLLTFLPRAHAASQRAEHNPPMYDQDI